MTINGPTPLTKDTIDTSPELTIEDVASDEERILLEAKSVVSDAIKRADKDPSALLEPEAIKAAALISRNSSVDWFRIRNSLKAYGVLKELDRLVRIENLKQPKGNAKPPFSRDSVYQIINGAICIKKATQGVSITARLANFSARIVSEQLRDDCSGEEPSRIFEIEGLLQTGKDLPRILVPADRYASMSWVVQCWGATGSYCCRHRRQRSIAGSYSDIER